MSGIAPKLTTHSQDVQVWSAEDCIRDMSSSPQNAQVAIADASGAVSLFDYGNNQLVWSKFAHELGASLIDWRADGELIASAGQDGYIKIWHPKTGEVVKVLQTQGLWVEQLQWSPDSQYLAAAAGKAVIVWDRAGKEVVHYASHLSTVTSIAWKYNSKDIATACYKGVQLFRVGYNRPYQSLSCLGSLISLVWSPDGKAICAGSQDRMLQYWILKNNKNHHVEMKGYPEKLNVIDWDKNSELLATSGSKDIIVWITKKKSPAGSKPKVLKCHSDRVTAIKFQKNGKLLASAANDGSVCVWDLENSNDNKEKWQLDSSVTKLIWSHAENRLILGTQNGSIFKLDEVNDFTGSKVI